MVKNSWLGQGQNHTPHAGMHKSAIRPSALFPIIAFCSEVAQESRGYVISLGVLCIYIYIYIYVPCNLIRNLINVDSINSINTGRNLSNSILNLHEGGMYGVPPPYPPLSI